MTIVIDRSQMEGGSSVVEFLTHGMIAIVFIAILVLTARGLRLAIGLVVLLDIMLRITGGQMHNTPRDFWQNPTNQAERERAATIILMVSRDFDIACQGTAVATKLNYEPLTPLVQAMLTDLGWYK